MSSRSLHDALLTVLSDGELRSRVVLGGSSATTPPAMTEDDWAVVSRLPPQRLTGVARFLARQYYRERISRLFRYVRLLSPITGRDPITLLQGSEINPVLDTAVLGSLATATRLLDLIGAYLTDEDDAIQAELPFWRDLVRYQATLFLVEAEGSRTTRTAASAAATRPHRAPATRLLDCDWDLPDLFQQLRTIDGSSGHAPGLQPRRRATTLLLLACGPHGRLSTIRCNAALRTLVEAADGTRNEPELAAVAGLSPGDAALVLRSLREVGALE